MQYTVQILCNKLRSNTIQYNTYADDAKRGDGREKVNLGEVGNLGDSRPTAHSIVLVAIMNTVFQTNM